LREPDRLKAELRLPRTAEAIFGVPAAPVARQLVADAERPLPDVLPPPPEWTTFRWPLGGKVNFEGWWREVDRRR
jgi:hypothetical protein